MACYGDNMTLLFFEYQLHTTWDILDWGTEESERMLGRDAKMVQVQNLNISISPLNWKKS